MRLIDADELLEHAGRDRLDSRDLIFKMIEDSPTVRLEYFFITVFEKMELDELGWPDTGASRCWGFYTDKDTAIQALHENWTNMEETVYKYAVLEGHLEGIAHLTGYQQWFKFDIEKKGYFEIEKPKPAEHFCGWSIS